MSDNVVKEFVTAVRGRIRNALSKDYGEDSEIVTDVTAAFDRAVFSTALDLVDQELFREGKKVSAVETDA